MHFLLLLPAVVSLLLGAGVLYLLPLVVGLLAPAVMSVLNGVSAISALSAWPKRGVAMAVVLALMSAGAYGSGLVGLPTVTPAVFVMASVLAFLVSQGVFHVAVEPTPAATTVLSVSPASPAVAAAAVAAVASAIELQQSRSVYTGPTTSDTPPASEVK